VRAQAVGFGGGQQAHDRGGAFAGAGGADEQPVLAAECDLPDGVFYRVVDDRSTADQQG
jgi:hypothetical protein